MKTLKRYFLTSATAIGLTVSFLFSQSEIIFNPAELIPHEDGYYIAGVYLDLNDDGTPEFYNGCFDGYENPLSPQDNHHETGTQQGFSYINCMIMPTCTHKSTPIEPPVPDGYIQMAPSLYLGTDSASISAVFTPPVMNLQSLFMETSSDVSINDNRKIPYNIDYSKDNGVTWEDSYIQDYVEAQGGYRVTYNSESHLEFEEMVNVSKTNPVIIRISTNDVSLERPYKGQYVKIHSVKLMADLATDIVDRFDNHRRFDIRIIDRTVFSGDFFMLYNGLGQLVGSGKTICLPSQGLYIVKWPKGASQKIFIP
jgi:hypothetical protein